MAQVKFLSQAIDFFKTFNIKNTPTHYDYIIADVETDKRITTLLSEEYLVKARLNNTSYYQEFYVLCEDLNESLKEIIPEYKSLLKENPAFISAARIYLQKYFNKLTFYANVNIYTVHPYTKYHTIKGDKIFEDDFVKIRLDKISGEYESGVMDGHIEYVSVTNDDMIPCILLKSGKALPLSSIPVVAIYPYTFKEEQE